MAETTGTEFLLEIILTSLTYFLVLVLAQAILKFSTISLKWSLVIGLLIAGFHILIKNS